MTTAVPPLLDPFERETTLAGDQPRALAFSSRVLELPTDELLRHLAFDLVGGIPRPIGDAVEQVGEDGAAFSYRQEFAQIGPAVLAIVTRVEEPAVTHRVVELLGATGDNRLRLSFALPRAAAGSDAARCVGQVRLWTSDTTSASEVRRVLARQLQRAGLEAQVLARDVVEPAYRPPAAERVALDALPQSDVKVTDALVALLGALPIAGAAQRAPRLVGAHTERLRKGAASVAYRYETHRAATGVLHVRRREVEAGLERPGLVRTFNVAGLRGAGRLRIREVGGRAAAEYAGTSAAVASIREALQRAFAARVP